MTNDQSQSPTSVPQSAGDVYASLQDRLADVANETEVRDRFCGELYAYYNITFRLERGRSDARLNRAILEFKGKGLFNGKTTSAAFQKAYLQLVEKYIPEQAEVEDLPVNAYIGIAIDGVHYAFVFFEENGVSRHTSLMLLTPESLYPLLEAILQDRRRAFTTENLLADFGPESPIAKDIIRELWKHLRYCLRSKNGVQKVRMLFREWTRLFAQATSLGQIGQERIDDYLRSIGLTPPLDHTRALFVLHTYNALLFKLLAAELVSTLRFQAYTGFASESAGCLPDTLRDQLERRIEHAEIFVNNDIENFIEGTYFSWYIEQPPATLMNAVREMLARLGLYMFPAVPHRSIQDVLKVFYQNIVPEALRKNIGEFYTPEWLVEFVLDRAGYTGKVVLNKRLLDPCCGSGNFLIRAIARYREVAEEERTDRKEIALHILESIIGFDLNPLAVIAARVNFLLAISDLLTDIGRIEIPVYLADAVYAPTRDEKTGVPTRSYKIGTVLDEIEFVLPETLVQRRQDFGLALSVMEKDIEAGNIRENYIKHLHRHSGFLEMLDANPDWTTYIGDMYDRVQAMEQKNWNRIWCRIIRNYFASVAIGEVDVIVGNPPWVRWSELPKNIGI